jgi:thiamine biosynthesis lipoprotein
MPDAARIARKLATLAELGLERIEFPCAATEAARVEPRAWRVVSTRPAMGTIVSITGLASSRARAEDAIGRAFSEMDRLIGVFSRYDGASALSVLNRAGGLDAAPGELAGLVATSLDYHALTSGAFDVTVAPLLELFRRRLDASVPAEPSAGEIRDALERVGARHLAVSRRGIGFGREGMQVTLDGIAKGYIVDAMARALERGGVKRYLINAGGDIRTRATKEGGAPWTIAVRDPGGGAAFPDAVRLTAGAVATSGSYEVSFDGDERFHHIVDAATGRSPAEVVSVSVVAPTAVAADALATGVFVLGPARGLSLLDGLRGCAGLVIGRDGRQWRSRRWTSALPTGGREAES